MNFTSLLILLEIDNMFAGQLDIDEQQIINTLQIDETNFRKYFRMYASNITNISQNRFKYTMSEFWYNLITYCIGNPFIYFTIILYLHISNLVNVKS